MNLLELLEPHYSYDNGDKIRHIYIVGPYPTEDFFRGLFENFEFEDYRKNLVTFLVDKSSYNNAVEIKYNLVEDEYISRNSQFKIIAINGKNGKFVHSKMYYFEIIKPNGTLHTCLITGSGNASTRAYSFGYDEEMGYTNDYNNAETNIVTTIKREDRKFVEDYFELQLKDDSKNDSDVYTLPITAVEAKIHFPKIEKIDVEENNNNKYYSFSNWVLDGYIYYKYKKATDLGKVRIQLEDKFMGSNEFTDLAKYNGFDGDNELCSLAYNYVEIPKNETTAYDSIKKKYLCETSYGYWAPIELKECIDYEIDEMVEQNEATKKMLDTIKGMGDNAIENKVKEIIEKLCAFTENAKNSGLEIGSYFKINNETNKIDKEDYEEKIKNQIESQVKQCKNKVFYNRCLRGYEDFNASYLENCIDDLADDVLNDLKIKLGKSRVVNAVCQAIRYEVDDDDIDSFYDETNDKENEENIRKITTYLKNNY